MLDLGSSTGFITDEVARAGGAVVGVDIDKPGLARSKKRFGEDRSFLAARGEALPFRDESFDVIVFNHIYEHTVDPIPVMGEIERVLKPDGAVYLGLANRFGVMEPHYRLPFLSYLPPGAADRYVRALGRSNQYHERLRSRRALRRLCDGLLPWDYTYTVMAEPQAFLADDTIRGWKARVPVRAWRLAQPIFPTFLWVAVKGDRQPAGRPLAVPPTRVPTSRERS